MQFLNLFENTFNQINSGGTVMWILIALSFLIWALICKVLYSLEINTNNDSKDNYFNIYSEYVGSVAYEKSSTAIDLVSSRVNLDTKIIKSLIAVAPLLGLLGTVGGMIETFASLETMEMFKPSGGIAAGVSQALLTTQFGLIVAVPALLFLKYVEMKKKNLLESLSNILSERFKLDEI